MDRNVGTVGKFDYNFGEYIATRLMKPFSCCCKHFIERKLKRLNNYEAAGEKLTSELDIVRILSAIRLTEFLSVLTLKKYQRVFTQHFMKYQVEEIHPSYSKKNAIDPAMMMSINAPEPVSAEPKQSEL